MKTTTQANEEAINCSWKKPAKYKKTYKVLTERNGCHTLYAKALIYNGGSQMMRWLRGMTFSHDHRSPRSESPNLILFVE